MQLVYRWRSQDRKWYKGFLDLWNPKAAVHLMITKKQQQKYRGPPYKEQIRVIILKRSSGKRNLKTGLVFIPYILTLVYSMQCFFFPFPKTKQCMLFVTSHKWVGKQMLQHSLAARKMMSIPLCFIQENSRSVIPTASTERCLRLAKHKRK